MTKSKPVAPKPVLAPVRISPEVRKLILEILEDAAANWVGGSTINEAIAFVEALP